VDCEASLRSAMGRVWKQTTVYQRCGRVQTEGRTSYKKRKKSEGSWFRTVGSFPGFGSAIYAWMPAITQSAVCCSDVFSPSSHFSVEVTGGVTLLRLQSEDGTNRLTRACVQALTEAVRDLAEDNASLVITGSSRAFSAGADLREIAALTSPDAYQFSKMGQMLMDAVASFRVPVIAAITGYCMGGGLDLALACGQRIASPHAIFGHRGAALGLITGWGGTQRLPRLIGKGRALELLIATEKIQALQALRFGLVDSIVVDPVTEALGRYRR